MYFGSCPLSTWRQRHRQRFMDIKYDNLTGQPVNFMLVNQTRPVVFSKVSMYFPLADLSRTCVLVLLSLLYKYKRHDRAICYIPHHPIHQLVNHQDFSRMKVTFWWFTVQFLPLKKQESEEQVENSKFVTSVHCWPVLTHIGCKWWFIES